MKLKIIIASALFSTAALAGNLEGTNLSVHMESAHFSGAGNNIAISRLPITNEDTGKVSYYDLTARFSVNASGDLVFDKVTSMSAVSFANANMLISGEYFDEVGCSWDVSQPAKDGNGSLIWTLGRGGKDYKRKSCGVLGFRVSHAPIEKNQALVGSEWCISAAKKENMGAGLIGVQDYRASSKGGIASVTQGGTSIGISLAKCSYKAGDDGISYGYLYDHLNYHLAPKA